MQKYDPINFEIGRTPLYRLDDSRRKTLVHGNHSEILEAARIHPPNITVISAIAGIAIDRKSQLSHNGRGPGDVEYERVASLEDVAVTALEVAECVYR